MKSIKKCKVSLLATVIAGSTILAIVGYRKLINSIVDGITIDSLTINE